MTIFTFAALGLGAGAVYALAALGLVQIYRGSGVLNFAHGAYVLLAAVVFARLHVGSGVPIVLAALVAIGGAALAGVLTQVLVMRPLASAAPLVRIIATLGVLTVIQQGIPLALGDDVYTTYNNVPSFLPAGGVRLASGLIPYDRIIVVAAVILIAAGVWGLTVHTRFGLVTTAVAESPTVAEALRVSPGYVAMINWGLGGALAGVAGVAIAPISGIAPASLVLLVVPALGAALAGGFSSYPITVTVAIAMGAVQSILTRYQSDIFPSGWQTGWPDAFPFLVIIVVLVFRGDVFPKRGDIAARLPAVGRRRIRAIPAAFVAIAAAASVGLSNPRLAHAILVTTGLAIVGLSLVVLTGLAGQISLGQLAISGVGALFAARVGNWLELPFLALLPLAALGAALTGLVFGLPALRTRGPVLGVVSMGLALVVQYAVFNSKTITGGGLSGTPIEAPSLFGWNIGAIDHPNRAAAFQTVLLVVMGFAVCNLRAGPLGRRFLALRSNERAAASLGINVARTKLTAFVLASAISGVGGLLIGYQAQFLTYERFGVLPSLQLVVFTAIGGIGYVLGPLVGAIGAPGGLFQFLFSDLPTVQRWLLISSGATLIITLIFNQNGVVGAAARSRRPPASRAQWRRGDTSPTDGRGASLVVRDMTVRYGRVTAVANLSLTIEPGQIVGLVGPNGAGKTSAIDAISGFAPISSGSVTLGGHDMTSSTAHDRARAGLGRTFQQLELFDDLTVEENLACGLENKLRYEPLLGLIRVPPLTFGPVMSQVCDALQLASESTSYPSELPQGKRRALGVARAMAGGPHIVLLDEPAAGLNMAETRVFGDMLQRIAREANVGFLLIEHDMSIVAAICDRVIALDFGSTIFEGTPEAMMADNRVRDSYLGHELAADSSSAAMSAT